MQGLDRDLAPAGSTLNLHDSVEGDQRQGIDIERATRLHLAAEKSDLEVQNADLEAQNAFLKEANSRLEHLVREFRRARFGPRSEKLDSDQQQLTFEDIEIAIASQADRSATERSTAVWSRS